MASDLKVTHVECGCHDHLVVVNSWPGEGDCYLTLWSPIHSKEWGRLHWAWQSMRGRWAGDNEVVLYNDQVRELRDALTEHLDRIEPLP